MINTRGEELPIKESLIRLSVLRRQGKDCSVRFRCSSCKRFNNIPNKGEGKTVISCGSCKEINYLDTYTVIEYHI